MSERSTSELRPAPSGFKELLHPDQAPWDFYLFPNLKGYLCGKQFKDDDDLNGERRVVTGARQKHFIWETQESFVNIITRV